MACFDNLVALKELCNSVTPVSGIYLNDVGVDLNLVNSVITKEFASPQEFVDSKLNLAITTIKSEIYNKYASHIKTRSVVENARVGYTVSNLVSVTGGGNRGIFLQVYNNANFFELEISQLNLHTNFTGTIPVFIYDLDQNVLLDTVNVTSVAGEISVNYPHLKYTADKKYLNLWIGYDATGINSYKTTAIKNQCCGKYCNTNSYVRAKGVTATAPFVEENLTQIQDTAGMSIVYSLTCDPYGWMCSIAQLLSLAIAYKAASEIFKTAVLQTPQSRTNNATTVNYELMEKNYNYYERKYVEALESVTKRVNLPCDSICFECSPPARTTVTLP